MRDQFDCKLIENNLRGIFAEYLVAEALGGGWEICKGSWYSWDIYNVDMDTRIEVKSSAYIQSWYDGKMSRPNFDIAPRSNGWDGKRVTKVSGRAADIYIFALHAELDPQKADQRDASQWKFKVVQSKLLPEKQKSIGIRPLESLSKSVSYKELKTEILSKVEPWSREQEYDQ